MYIYHVASDLLGEAREKSVVILFRGVSKTFYYVFAIHVQNFGTRWRRVDIIFFPKYEFNSENYVAQRAPLVFQQNFTREIKR